MSSYAKKRREDELKHLISQMSLATWIDAFGTVFSQETSERIPFKLWPEQRRLYNQIEAWRKDGYQEFALPKARQNGASEGAGEQSLKDTLCYPNNEILCISGNLLKAEQFLKSRFLAKYLALPRNIGIVWPEIVRETKTVLEFSNGSVFMSLPASDTAGQGFSSSGVVIDECGAIDLNNNASFDGVFRNVKPAVEKAGKRGWIYQIGTSEPGTEWNAKIKRIKDGKDLNTKMYFIGWRADPNRDEAWLEKTRHSYSNEIDFKTQYPETIDDFFVVKEGLVVPQFNEAIHVQEFEPPRYFTRLYFGYDHGYRHPSVYITAFYDYKNDHIYIRNAEYWTEKGIVDQVPLIKAVKAKAIGTYGLVPQKEVADSAIWQKKDEYSIADEFRKQGINFSKASKHRGLVGSDGSLEKLRSYFYLNKITIHPDCQNLVNDLNNWKYKKGTSESIEDKNDDGPDVLRYLIAECNPIPSTSEVDDVYDGYRRADSSYGKPSGFTSSNEDNSSNWMKY